jgi:hypothetical protein
VIVPAAKAWCSRRDRGYDDVPCNWRRRCNGGSGARGNVTVTMPASAHDCHVTRACRGRCRKARVTHRRDGVTAEAMPAMTTEVVAAMMAAICKPVSAKASAGMCETATETRARKSTAKTMSAMTEAAAECMTTAEAAAESATTKGMATAEAASATKSVAATAEAAAESTTAKAAAAMPAPGLSRI